MGWVTYGSPRVNDSDTIETISTPYTMRTTIRPHNTTMRNLSTLISTSVVTTYALRSQAVYSYLSIRSGTMLSANTSNKLWHSELRSMGRRGAKCTARMIQSRDFSSSNERITLEKIVASLKEYSYKKVLIVAGAGVSCSAGIPDVSCSEECILHAN